MTPMTRGLLRGTLFAMVALGAAFSLYHFVLRDGAARAGQQQAGQQQAGEQGRQSLIDRGELPPFTFLSTTGQVVSREELRGRTWIVDFIFTTCAGTCPQMSKNMQRLQRELVGLADLRLVSITCDPETDTQERLAGYAKQWLAEPDRWLFVTGKSADIQRFAQQALGLGVHQSTPEEMAQGAERIVHSQRFVLVDPRAHVRGYYDGTDDAAVTRLLEDVRRLQSER